MRFRIARETVICGTILVYYVVKSSNVEIILQD